LLTGVAARGTVVISGARSRHQKLVSQIAQALDDQPTLAAPLEAFLDLLIRGEDARRQSGPGLPGPQAEELIPLFDQTEWPEELPDPDGPDGGYALSARLHDESWASAERSTVALTEPKMEYDRDAFRDVALLVAPDVNGRSCRFVQSRTIIHSFPTIFGVVLDDDAMTPMFASGDALLVAVGAAPRVGRPALCKFVDRADDRCRIWLGDDGEQIHLGRAADGETEHLPRAALRWSLEVLYRVTRAA
jgi:hypothetical protein